MILGLPRMSHRRYDYGLTLSELRLTLIFSASSFRYPHNTQWYAPLLLLRLVEPLLTVWIAWAVDFATSLADHEDLIKGTQNLLAFAQRSTQPQPPSLSYVSTIGTYQSKLFSLCTI